LDLLPLGFLLLVVVVSGGIAYAADNLGKKLGKKRLSLFGLRPRHTAALGTVLLGMAVSLLTIGLVAALSKDVRDWITKGSQALASLQKEQQQLQKVEQQRDGELADIGDLEKKINDRGQELKRVEDRLQTQIKGLKGQIEPLETRLGALSTEIATKEGQLQAAQLKLAASEKSFLAKKAEAVVLGGDLNKVDKRYNEALKQNQTLDAEIIGQITLIAGQKKDIQDREADLDDRKRELSRVTTALDEVNHQLGNQQYAYKTLKSEFQSLGESYAKLKSDNDQLQAIFASSFAPSRELPPICLIHQEICRLELPPGMPREDAERALNQLMEQAKLAAGKLGAHSQATYDVADLYTRPDGTTPDQIKELTIKQLTERRGESVLVAYAAMNTFLGEPLPLDLGVFDNPLVYPRGQVVKDASIDGHQPREQILKQLNSFAQSLKSKAKFDQMLPKLNDPESFGSLDAGQVLQLVEDIKAHDRPVKLVAIAKSNIRAADPLDVEFRVR